MKKNITALELSYVLKELKVLLDSKLDKIYHPDKKTLLLQFHITSKGKKILRINLPDYIYLTDYKEKSPEKPSGLCMVLRKNLEQSRLRSIKQLGSERIVELLFEKKEKHKLFIELFSPGNIILCKEDGTIISALETKKWKERTIRGGIEYVFPKHEVNFFDLKKAELKELLKSTEKDSLVTCLAIDLGLGGVYAEESCLLAEIDKKINPKKLNEDNLNSLLKAIKSLCNKKINPCSVYDEKNLIDITPFSLELYKDFKKQDFKRYNEALDNYFTGQVKEEKIDESELAHKKQVDKLNKIIDEQQKQVERMQTSIKTNSEKAELIYTNYKLIESIITELKKAREKYSWQEIKEKLKGHKIIKDINEKEGKIIIEV
ncbi:MAG: NFACT family protein [Nanoarchaeota archaeon]|nr:NFACT family protein [Nanoarchaeota archaeon]